MIEIGRSFTRQRWTYGRSLGELLITSGERILPEGGGEDDALVLFLTIDNFLSESLTKDE